MITPFDAIDAALVALVIAVAVAHRAWWARWSIGGLVTYHLLGRIVAWQMVDPLPSLALMQLAVAAGYLLGPILSVYGRAVGVLFVAMSMSSVIAAAFGIVPQMAGGIAIDLWNFQSACLDLVAITTCIGIIRHGKLRRGDMAGSDIRG